MRFYTAFLAGALAAMAAAQNPFTITTIPTTIPAGTTFNVTWEPTSPGTISLILVKADTTGSNNVRPVSTIAGKIANSGTFVWSVPQSIPKGTGYALEIVSDDNTNIINYTGQFAIDSTTSPSASVSGSASASASASASGSTVVTVTTSAASSASSASPSKAGNGNSTVTFTSGSPTIQVGPTVVGGTSTPTSSSKNAGALQTAGAGMGLVAFLGAAVLAL